MNQVEVKRRQIEVYSYLIGLISIIIFGGFIGDNGITCFVIALEAFLLLRAVVVGALSDSLGRMLRSRKSKGQFKNVSCTRKRVMIFQVILGILFSILFALCPGLLAKNVFQVPYSSFLMAVMAPVLLLQTVSAVLEGYFKGEGTELPVAVSMVLRQIFTLGFGLLFVNILGGYGEKVSKLLGEDAYTAMYGGVGIAVGMILAEALVLLFLGLIFWSNRNAKAKQDSEGLKRTESLGDTIKILCSTRGSTVLLILLCLLPLCLGAVFYRKSLLDVAVFVQSYGGYAGKYLTVCGIISLAVYAPLIAANARIIGCLRKEEPKYAKSFFQGGLQMGVVMVLFFAVIAAVMAPQLTGVFYAAPLQQTIGLFRSGSAWIIFATLGCFFSGLLSLTGKKYYLLGCLGVSNIIFVITVSLFLNVAKAGIMSLVYAALIAGAVYCLALGFVCCHLLRTGIDWLKVIVIPAGVASVIGLVCLLIGKLLTPHLGNTVTLIACVVPAFLLYMAILILCRCFREQDIKYLPGGKLIHAVGQMLHVF